MTTEAEYFKTNEANRVLYYWQLNCFPKSNQPSQQTKEKVEETPLKKETTTKSSDVSTMYYEARLKVVEELKKQKQLEPYPHKFHYDLTIAQLYTKFSYLGNSQASHEFCAVPGRILKITPRDDSVIYYLEHKELTLPVLVKRSQVLAKFISLLALGDVIGTIGQPSKSSDGQLILIAKELRLLAPCLRLVPPKLEDSTERYKQRYLDFLINIGRRKIFFNRAKIINHLRKFLDDRGFSEVETPILTMNAGGAHAVPFITHHIDLNIDLCMRTATEIYLKQLVVGGFDKVYEIGKNFRNETIDASHNAEFTSCELCAVYIGYVGLMYLLERLIGEISIHVTGNTSVPYHVYGENSPPVALDLTPPFVRLSLIPELEKAVGAQFPKDLESADAHKFLLDLCKKHNVVCPPPTTSSRLFQQLVSRFIYPMCVHPTFVIDWPTLLSPLARGSSNGTTQRFELIIAGIQIASGYSDLNDPFVILKRYEAQAAAKAQGDETAQIFHETFSTALEYGLPPSSGCGIGIDRLTMILSDSQTIKEVVFFPSLVGTEDKVVLTQTKPHSDKSQKPVDHVSRKPKKSVPKPEVIQRSHIVFDINPVEEKTNMQDLENKVRAINMPGLEWKVSKLEPLAYGITKLRIRCVVEDKLVDVETLEESISQISDVQSVKVTDNGNKI
eukprot:TRINITY_DN1444_c0_g1_i1.p1 TRINITY_DN1444_c0_g1~~TRINITY_DN1444_c0_g1_i1.p1  ORF type:complete len:672 (-),score=128.11 TRINITY_DN1444_c0_g1_i1:31-2046(-)